MLATLASTTPSSLIRVIPLPHAGPPEKKVIQYHTLTMNFFHIAGRLQ